MPTLFLTLVPCYNADFGVHNQGRHLRGLGAIAPQGKEKKKNKRKKRKKRKKERKKEGKGTMNNVKLLHQNKSAAFFQFFNSPVALKN